MKKLLLVGGSIIGIFVLTLLLVGGYYGLVPFFSTVMGATTPIDLGVTYTQQQADDFNQKSKVAVNLITEAQSAAESVKFNGQQAVKTTFSQEEISARLNYDPWVYQVVENAQVRTNADGSVEVSGNIALNKIDEFLAASGYQVSQEDLQTYLPYLEKVTVNPAFYIKAAPQVTNNQISIGFQEARVANYAITGDQFNANEVLDQWATTLLNTVDGADINLIKFDENGAYLDGTLPQSITVLTNGN